MCTGVPKKSGNGVNTIRIFSMPMWFLVVLCLCAAFTEAENLKYKDPKQPLNVRIKDLMKRMTLEEKIGQMTQIERKLASPDVMKKYFIGSVLSGGGSVPGPKASAEEWVNMEGKLRVEDPDLLKRIGAATALEVRATGIPYAFAPCIAVCRDPRWGRCYESYSEDHKIVQAMTEIIPGLQGDLPANSRKGVPFVAGKTKVAGCAKHFVGDGGTVNGIDENNTVIDYNGLLNIHMPAYFDSIRKGVATVMVSYSSWNGKKMHANQELVTGFLKNKLKFRGFVISDWQGIDRITSPPHVNYSYSVQAEFLQESTWLVNIYDLRSQLSPKCNLEVWFSARGILLIAIMLPENFTEFIDDLTFQVKNNVIPMSRIDDAVRRILRVKFVMGLFEDPIADLSLADKLGNQEHRDLAREAARKSLVLLKNGKNANQPNYNLRCCQKDGRPFNASRLHGESRREFRQDQWILLRYRKSGEVPYAEMFGDSKNLSIIDPGPSTIKNVCGAVKCVVVVVSGRPVVIEPYLAQIDALVAAWLPGSEGGPGIADALFGDYGFTGKLARTWFKSVDQLPMNVGDPHYDPLFAFGFGLTTKARQQN
ncbi:hypothetical protein DH2020_000534 [Rehmannia glutinosa]|uniref:beta-glucosidase n=1 Tax=Rehmannia glutinosa TaxID=99300 RepID=A0ABR0XXF3_REHGL